MADLYPPAGNFRPASGGAPAVKSVQIDAPAAGGTTNVVGSSYKSLVVFTNINGALASYTIGLPTNPNDGDICYVCNRGPSNITALSVVTQDGSGMIAFNTGVAASIIRSWIYCAAANFWQRLD